MGVAPVPPSEELVRASCREYDGDIAERALKELFTQYPRNTDRAHVLLKLVTLNRLYSAGILAVYDVADHICKQQIDAALSYGAPEVVDRIAKVPISSSGKQRGFWSFATKYCSWHNQASYPMWDSRVCRYLRSLNKHLRSLNENPFADPDYWTNYQEFRDLIGAFRDRYKLGSFSFKEIDMFLWKYGAKPPAEAKPSTALGAGTQI